jgi:hypothetical protein
MAEVKDVLLRLPVNSWHQTFVLARQNGTSVTEEIRRAVDRHIVREAQLSNSGRYTVEAMCRNCGFEGTLEIPRGSGLEMANCPNCDCVRRLQRLTV